MFGEEHAFGLLASVVDGVSKQETALFVGVAMQIKESEELPAGLLK